MPLRECREDLTPEKRLAAEHLVKKGKTAPLGWSYVCRTAMSTTATWEGETFRLDVLGACLQPGRRIDFKEAYVTREV